MIIEHEVSFDYLKMYTLYEIFYLEVMNAIEDKSVLRKARFIMEYLQEQIYGKDYNPYTDTIIHNFKSVYEIEK